MRVALVIAGLIAAPAFAQQSIYSTWGAGAFNSSYMPPGTTLGPPGSWGPPPQRTWATPGGSVVPWGGYGYGLPAYGSTYYGFEPTEPEAPAPAPAPAPVVIFERSAPEPAPQPEPAPPQIIVVQMPAPAPPPPPAQVVAERPEPEPDRSPPREVYHWVDADGVHNYSTMVPPEMRGKATRVGSP